MTPKKKPDLETFHHNARLYTKLGGLIHRLDTKYPYRGTHCSRTNEHLCPQTGSPEDDDLPTKIQPVAQDDHLPKGESDTAIIDDGSDVGKEDYRNTDDWDPAQEDTAQIPSSRTVATWVLRQVKIGGKNFINAFDASLNQKFIFLRNSLKKANELKCVENTKASGKLRNGYERNHVQDLGA